MSFNLTQLKRMAKNGNDSAAQALAKYEEVKASESNTTKKISDRPTSKVPILIAQLAQSGIRDIRWSEHSDGEYMFHPTRKWRLDCYHAATKVALEVEGGIASHGKNGNISRHLHSAGYEKDIEKYFNAELMGIWVIRASSEMVKSGFAVSMFIQAMEHRGYVNPQPNEFYESYKRMFCAT